MKGSQRRAGASLGVRSEREVISAFWLVLFLLLLFLFFFFLQALRSEGKPGLKRKPLRSAFPTSRARCGGERGRTAVFPFGRRAPADGPPPPGTATAPQMASAVPGEERVGCQEAFLATKTSGAVSAGHLREETPAQVMKQSELTEVGTQTCHPGGGLMESSFTYTGCQRALGCAEWSSCTVRTRALCVRL